MKLRILGKYESFQCIADKCPSTCCSGWSIEIDDEAIEKYKSMSLEGVDYSEQCFKNKSNGDCYFLNENKLCDLYLKHGEGIFCRTCDMYPRHIEEFPDVREYSLSISCPEVARMYLDPDTNVTNIYEQSNTEVDTEEYDEFDFETYDKLVECRDVLFEIALSDASLRNKIYNILSITADLQECIDIGSYDEISYDITQNTLEIDDILVNSLFDIFLELEPLNGKFREKVNEYSVSINKIDLNKVINNFDSLHENIEEILSRILHYFIYTYFCGAIYDEYIYGMAAVSVFSVVMLHVFMALEEETKGNVLTAEEMAEIVYMYSRELEHSTENMIKLEQMLEDNRLI